MPRFHTIQTQNTARDYIEIGAAFVIIIGLLFALGELDLLPRTIGLSDTMSYGLVFIIGLVASVSSCIAVTGGLLVAIGLIVIVLDRLPPVRHPDPRSEGWLFMAGVCLVVFGAFFIMANRRPAKGPPCSGNRDAPRDRRGAALGGEAHRCGGDREDH